MNFKNSVLTRAPTRICDIGGWTDTWFYPKGAVFSFCVDLYSYVKLVENGSKAIKIFAENLKQSAEILNLKKIEYNGVLDLLKSAIKRMNIENGLDIFVRADAPPGCGTGTSASVAVTLISALAIYKRLNMDQNSIAALAHKLETEELGLESGVQDQYSAAFGGINFMEIDYPKVKLTKIEIDENRILELENQFILVYFGSRSSSKMHNAVISNYKNRDEATINSFEIMRQCAYEMKDSINSDMDAIGEIINKNWEAQKSLHPLMINPIVSKAEKIAKSNGALGFKCNGAGGGGSATILSERGQEYKIKKKLIKNGYTILPCKLSFTGVRSYG
jgi:D-glycero-alpha-D-manno-heptose-7-phosphate kinase